MSDSIIGSDRAVPLSSELGGSSLSQATTHLSYGLLESHAAGYRRRIQLAPHTIHLQGRGESPTPVPLCPAQALRKLCLTTLITSILRAI